MLEIRHLPRSICGPLRSGVVLFDLPKVVEELVNNSLDAGATKVLVFINIGASYVKVEDDGHGITRDELVILGEKYATSKTGAMDDKSASTLGFRGEALSSLSDISVVEVRTKGRGKPNAYCKIIKGSRCLFLGIDDQREHAGTTVIARDLFYNQPVRRRYMQSSPKKVLLSLKKCILRIALVHSHVSFRVTDIENDDELLHTAASSSPLQLVSDAFGSEVSSSLHKIVYSDQSLMLSGYMSAPNDAFSRKAFQYLYINSRFVSKSPIHNLLNNMASNTWPSLAQQRIPEIQSEKRHKIQAYPAFMLNLSCSFSLYDLNFEPSKTIIEFRDWSAILTFFEKAVTQFWLQYSPEMLEGNSYSHITSASGKCGPQKEDFSASDVLKSFQTKKKRGKNQLEELSLDNSLTTMNVALEYIDFSESYGKSKKISGEVKSARSRTDDFDENCSFLHPSSDMEYVLGCENNNMDFLDINVDQVDVGSFILNDGLTSDLMPQIRQKYMPTLGGKYEILDMVRNRTFKNIAPDYPNAINDGNKSLALPEPGLDCCSLMEYEPCNLASCSINSDDCCAVCHSREEHFTWGIRGAKVADKDLSLGNRLHKEVLNASGPSRCVIRKCHTEENLKLSVANSSEPNDNLFAIDDNDSQIGLEEGRIGRHAPEAAWYLPPTCKWNVGVIQKTCYPVKAGTSGRKLMSFQGDGSWVQTMEDRDEYFSSWSSCCSFHSNTSFESNKQERDHFPSLRTLTHDNHPSDKLMFAKDETDCLYSDYRNTITNEDDSQSKWQSKQNCVETVEISCSGESSSYSTCQVRTKRSSSAPPIYKKKDKFSVLSNYLTAKVEEMPDFLHRMTDNACLATDIPHFHVSQPYPEVILTEDSQPCLRSPVHDNPSILEARSSHHLSNVNDISTYSANELVKWHGEIQESIDGEISHKSSEQISDILDISSGLLFLSGVLVPDSVDKGSLQDARVLLQLDRKFIPVVAGGTLLIIDQHAADERIRLEELRQKVIAGEGITVTYLDSEEELILPEMGFQLLQKYKEKIQKWGWIFNTQIQLSGSFGKNMNILKRRESGVTLIAVPCILGINLTQNDLLEFIDQLIQTDGSSSLPPSVVRILNFKACRGAIMFGDSLLPSECSLIVEELKKTSLCFQCAHGRPTTVPLLNIASLHEHLTRLNEHKGGPNRTWHGLQHHVPSIGRAQMLLDSAKRFHKD